MQAAICQVPPTSSLKTSPAASGRGRTWSSTHSTFSTSGNHRNDMGVDIPGREYPAVATVDGMVNYLASHGSRQLGRPRW